MTVVLYSTRYLRLREGRDDRGARCRAQQNTLIQEDAMHVGDAPLFQNPGNALSDAKVYRQERRLAEMAAPLGFDAISQPAT
jgi:hypothetical protein